MAETDPRHVDETSKSQSRGKVLNRDMAKMVRDKLPGAFRFMEWHLIYSPDVHGTSLQTFYRNQRGANIVVIRDQQGGVFGIFCEAGWSVEKDRFGEGNCKAFAFKMYQTAMHVFEFKGDIKDKVQWGAPEQFGLDVALLVNKDLLHGGSYASEFFGLTEPLSVMGETFDIRNIECWSLEEVGRKWEQLDGVPQTEFVDHDAINAVISKSDVDDSLRTPAVAAEDLPLPPVEPEEKPADTSDTTPATVDGKVLKLDRYGFRWEERRFEAQSGTLYLYSSSHNVRQRIDLTTSRCAVREVDGDDHQFVVKELDGKKDEMTLATTEGSEYSRAFWMKTLNTHIDFYNPNK